MAYHQADAPEQVATCRVWTTGTFSGSLLKTANRDHHFSAM